MLWRKVRHNTELNRVQSGRYQMRKLRSSATLEIVVDNSDSATNGRYVSKLSEGISGIIEQFRGLILCQDILVDELSKQRDQDCGTGIAKLVCSTTSKHDNLPKFGAVFCDEDGRLYRIDRKTDQYVPLTASDAFSSSAKSA
jgi:hypothetical protein